MSEIKLNFIHSTFGRYLTISKDGKSVNIGITDVEYDEIKNWDKSLDDITVLDQPSERIAHENKE